MSMFIAAENKTLAPVANIFKLLQGRKKSAVKPHFLTIESASASKKMAVADPYLFLI